MQEKFKLQGEQYTERVEQDQIFFLTGYILQSLQPEASIVAGCTRNGNIPAKAPSSPKRRK